MYAFTRIMPRLFYLPVFWNRAPPFRERKGAFVTRQYLDLFAEEGHSEAEVKALIEAAYQQLFHSDRLTQAIYIPSGLQ